MFFVRIDQFFHYTEGAHTSAWRLLSDEDGQFPLLLADAQFTRGNTTKLSPLSDCLAHLLV